MNHESSSPEKHTKKINLVFDSVCDIIKEFAPCMNDYLYVYDLDDDICYISEHALTRFDLKSNLFRDVTKTLIAFVYPDDLDPLLADLKDLISGKKDEHNMEYRWMGADGSPIWINCKGRLLYTAGGHRLMLGCINEIGKRGKADNISGLLGETSLRENMHQQLPAQTDLMFLRLGIDDFKLVNERHGVEYGNFVLRNVAEGIQNCLNEHQAVYRIVSDEFMVVDFSGAGYDAMNELYHRIRTAVDGIVAEQQYKAIYTVSGGLLSLDSLADPTLHDTNEILKLSEFALAEAKNRGKNQLYYFKPDDYSLFLRARYVRSCLRQALENDFQGFELYYQPIVVPNDEHLFAAETLLRFRSLDGTNIFPLEFIPILEESGLIIPVGKWIIRNAFDMCKKCREKYPDFRISINLSYIQLLKSPLFEDITNILRETGLPPSCLIVELTESGHLQDTTAVRNTWRKLKDIGVCIALDDFGTGYSNLINIGNLRPNIVKIDRSFTMRALCNEYEHELLIHIIRMVHSIGLDLVVEGIETESELQRITTLNPDYIQGYYYSKPCPASEFTQKYLDGRT